MAGLFRRSHGEELLEDDPLGRLLMQYVLQFPRLDFAGRTTVVVPKAVHESWSMDSRNNEDYTVSGFFSGHVGTISRCTSVVKQEFQGAS